MKKKKDIKKPDPKDLRTLGTEDWKILRLKKPDPKDLRTLGTEDLKILRPK